ncbi:hypothetical protein IMG5_170690 [Ichthyophthirius multifiliis]|uniref:Sperm-tail PG-rich repeat protein n=1 Tax=Ichthyophthirius multifiliis TaxID=5932 RepID=G0R1I4_ICHMU|nr:hypothetical protein IMG5_170690 [Ichthyophthirius multifiliis]EGR28685.1 hypothetical protein IMG5_170690 [Ichthyophthirius multifiliis]|eukprot:XP_004029921.1 hypothetical protein IMG5_170690 [Ichthyophthirius multifiliis]
MNNSHSKQQYTFPRTQRFGGTYKSYCQAGFYTLGTTLNNRSTGFGKGNKSDFTKMDKNKPGPDRYKVSSIFDKEQSKQKGIAFKLGRQEIAFRRMNEYTISPGPGHYEQDDSKQNRLYQYSMGKRTLNQQLISTALDNPGPGTYQVKGLNKSGKYFVSNFSNSKAPVFSNSQNGRFYDLYKPKNIPGPGYYEYESIKKQGVYYNSKLKSIQGGKFGHNSKQKENNIGIQYPGPGAYRILSEFGDVEFPPVFKNQNKFKKI